MQMIGNLPETKENTKTQQTSYHSKDISNPFKYSQETFF